MEVGECTIPSRQPCLTTRAILRRFLSDNQSHLQLLYIHFSGPSLGEGGWWSQRSRLQGFNFTSKVELQLMVALSRLEEQSWCRALSWILMWQLSCLPESIAIDQLVKWGPEKSKEIVSSRIIHRLKYFREVLGWRVRWSRCPQRPFSPQTLNMMRRKCSSTSWTGWFSEYSKSKSWAQLCSLSLLLYTFLLTLTVVTIWVFKV